MQSRLGKLLQIESGSPRHATSTRKLQSKRTHFAIVNEHSSMDTDTVYAKM